jgi:hypothetical protein
MAVEGAYQAFELVPPRLLSELAVLDSCPEVAADVVPRAEVHPERVKELLYDRKWILCPSSMFVSKDHALWAAKNPQLTAPDHIRDNQHEPVATQGQKNTRFVENPPHLRCHVVDHVLPSVGAWIVGRLSTISIWQSISRSSH